MNNDARVKAGHLKPLYQKAKEISLQFESVTFEQVPREHPKIKKVDKMANEALDKNSHFY